MATVGHGRDRVSVRGRPGPDRPARGETRAPSATTRIGARKDGLHKKHHVDEAMGWSHRNRPHEHQGRPSPRGGACHGRHLPRTTCRLPRVARRPLYRCRSHARTTSPVRPGSRTSAAGPWCRGSAPAPRPRPRADRRRPTAPVRPPGRRYTERCARGRAGPGPGHGRRARPPRGVGGLRRGRHGPRRGRRRVERVPPSWHRQSTCAGAGSFQCAWSSSICSGSTRATESSGRPVTSNHPTALVSSLLKPVSRSAKGSHTRKSL